MSVLHEHLIALMVEVWTVVLELQVQDTPQATYSTDYDCFQIWLFVLTLLSQYQVETIYCFLPLKTFLYKIERDGFTTQGITQLKKQLTV